MDVEALAQQYAWIAWIPIIVGAARRGLIAIQPYVEKTAADWDNKVVDALLALSSMVDSMIAPLVPRFERKGK